jgi:hypothetical protein
MLRKFVCAAIVVVFGLSIAMADEIQVLISKADGGKITYKKVMVGKGGKGGKGGGKGVQTEGDDITMPVKADAKITKGKFDMDAKKFVADEKIDGGLKSDTFTKIDEKGLRATIITDADNKNVTEIIVGGGFGGKGGKGGKKGAGN